MGADQRAIVDVRARSGLTQEAFAERFGFNVRSLRDWEQGRVQPSQAARSLLRVIATAPAVVADALRAA